MKLSWFTVKNLKRYIQSENLIGLILIFLSFPSFAQNKTVVDVSIPEIFSQIDLMIYGQMLENVNDSVIYGGVVNKNGTVRKHVAGLMKEIQIPIMRWPGGTVIHEYRWRNGIGPAEIRPTVKTHAWNGNETYQFGTDEFLQWCRDVGTTPYINFNMANNTEFGGTLGEALDWIEYVNGNADSTNFGKIRAFFGNHEPYQVLYWGIGNENYGPWGKHTAETAFGYAERLGLWAKTINSKFPGLHLLGVGHTAEWNKIVLEKAGTEIDYLTQHYYINSKFKDHEIENPFNSLFAPVLVEKHLSLLGDYLTYFNNQNRKTKRPVKLSIDEWNNRHSVYDGKEYKFSRNDPRRLIDATIAASMLNVFIRKSDIVGMANYIFPVNGHGLIRTIGDNGAIITPLFYVFKKYRETMNGQKLNTTVNGSGISALQIKPSIEGDCKEVLWGEEHLNFIDAAASLNKDGKIHVALINRSYNQKQSVSVKLPGDYKFQNRWILSGKNFNEFNNVGQEKSIAPKINSDGKKTKNGVNIIMEPCAVEILSFTPLWFN